MDTYTVADVMSTDVVSVTAETPYREVVDALEGRSVSAVPVVDRDNRVLGVVSETDLMYKMEFTGSADRPRLWERLAHRQEVAKAAGLVAGDLMTSPAVSTPANSSLAAVVRLMETTGVHRLPVVNDLGRLVGMVTRLDVLRVFLRPDADIARDAAAAAQSTVGERPDIAVTADARDGVVALDGEVRLRSTADEVAAAAGTVDGVVAVDNRIGWRLDDSPLARIGLG